MVTCELCNERMNVITWKHLSKHNITLNEYRIKFPNSPTKSQQAIENKKKGAIHANRNRKGVPRSQETIEKIKQTKKNNPTQAWNKGVPRTVEQNEALSKTRKEKLKSGAIKHWNVGNVTPDVVKKKISETLLAQDRVYSELSKQKRNQTLEQKKSEGWIPAQATKEFHDKIKQTVIKKYGVPYYQQLDFTELTVDLLTDDDWLIDQHHTQKRSLLDISQELGINGTTLSKVLKRKGIEVKSHIISTAEKEISQFLTDNNIDHITNDRKIISPLELDIVIPDAKVAIEHCGLYWHSHFHKPNTYHRDKMRKCNERGIRLITMFENEWIHNKDLVKQKLLSIVNQDNRKTVYARKCSIRTLDSKEKKTFFDANHIQGNGPGSITYGLEHSNEIVAAMTFIKQKNGEFVLNRYATLCKVPGGFTKLLKHFQRNNDWNTIVSFADLRWSEGNLYESNGWTLEKTLLPDYCYVVGDNIVHKFNYRRKNLPKLLKTFDPALSETENTNNNDIPRIYNCGLNKYTLTR